MSEQDGTVLESELPLRIRLILLSVLVAVADAFDVAVQDRMLVPREKSCKKNPPYAADTKGNFQDEDENATGRKLSKCELDQVIA